MGYLRALYIVEGEIMHPGDNPYKRFGQLVERHGELIERLCRRASYGRMKVCREMVQECYIALVDHLGDCPERGFAWERGWVLWQCRSAISRHRRSEKRHDWVPIDGKTAEALTASNPVTEGTFDELAAVLNDRERQFFALMVDGSSDEEMARRLGVTPRTVVQMRHGIKVKLQEYIKQ